MADGQDWALPDPPDEPSPSGRPGVGGYEDLGPEYEEAVAGVLEAEDEPGRRRAELALAIALLSRNYRLRPDDYWELLDAESGSPASRALAESLRGLAAAHAERLRARRGRQAPRPAPAEEAESPGSPSTGRAAFLGSS
jgi:hypothetical protein